MNRRGFLRFLGIAPIALPAAAMALGDAPTGGVRALLANSRYDTAFWRRVQATAEELRASVPFPTHYGPDAVRELYERIATIQSRAAADTVRVTKEHTMSEQGELNAIP